MLLILQVRLVSQVGIFHMANLIQMKSNNELGSLRHLNYMPDRAKRQIQLIKLFTRSSVMFCSYMFHTEIMLTVK